MVQYYGHRSISFGSVCKKGVLKNETPTHVFPVNFAKFLRRPFFTEHPRWLLLRIYFIDQNIKARHFISLLLNYI